MKIAKYLEPGADFPHVGLVEGDSIRPLQKREYPRQITEFIDSFDAKAAIESAIDPSEELLAIDQVQLLPPLENQEVWAAGVTYFRSRTARMEESETSASCYDLVYDAPRPELFLKATGRRAVGHGGDLRIRYDSRWNVPEPELTLVVSSQKKLVGFTVGNDMSSRDIEGENPLYLPQAKVYNQSCGLGPWIALADFMPADDAIGIAVKIERDGQIVFEESTSSSQLKRKFTELINWLFRDNDFPGGCFLMTGTGIVPGNEFTLLAGDRVNISIDGIGTLSNNIVQANNK